VTDWSLHKYSRRTDLADQKSYAASIRYDEAVSGVVCIKAEQFGA
jgi:hypothetical protein